MAYQWATEEFLMSQVLTLMKLSSRF